jgi:hypothetical protein
MRSKGLVMIKEPKTLTANPKEQRAEPDCSTGPTDFTWSFLKRDMETLFYLGIAARSESRHPLLTRKVINTSEDSWSSQLHQNARVL